VYCNSPKNSQNDRVYASVPHQGFVAAQAECQESVMDDAIDQCQKDWNDVSFTVDNSNL